MDKFDRVLAVSICAPTTALLRRGVQFFERVAGASTRFAGIGQWHGEIEPSVKLEYAFSSSDPAHIARVQRLLRAARLWQRAAKQYAVYVQLAHVDAWVVGENDWAQAAAEIAQESDDIRAALALCDWFDGNQAANVGLDI